MYLSHGNKCTWITSEDGLSIKHTVQEYLYCTQEEPDTKMILQCFHASQSCQDNSPIRIRSPDTADVVMLLLRNAMQTTLKT